MSITVKVSRDFKGYPTSLDITKRGKKVHVEMVNDRVTIRGRTDEEIRDVIKLFYPAVDEQRNFYDEGHMVQEEVSFAAVGVSVDLYTVPPHKKLFILNSFLHSSLNAAAGAGPWAGQLYVYNPHNDASLTILMHVWTQGAVGYTRSDSAGEIQKGFPSGFIVRGYGRAETSVACGFIGVIKDA